MDKEKPQYSSEDQAPEAEVSETIEDERSELDKKLEQIESIESRSLKATRPNADNGIGAERGVTSSTDPVEPHEPAEDPAILAARAAMRSANREDTKKSASQKKLRVAVVLLVVMVCGALAAVAGLYYWQTTTQNQLTSTQASLAAAQSELVTLKQAPATKPQPETTENSNQQEKARFRTINEWGIRYQLNEQNDDLGYGILTVAPQESIGLYSVALARTAGVAVGTKELRCGIGSAGVLVRLSEAQLKQLSPEQQPAETESKKIGEFTYVYQAPQGVCTDEPQQEKMVTDAARSVITTLESASER